MFRRLPFRDAFEFVASPEEWQRFRSFGAVTPIDLWLESMHDGASGRLDGYEALWTRLASAVRQKLIAGEWIAEGFVADRGPQAQPIDSALWPALEFELAEEVAAGLGFKFANLLITSNQSADAEASSAALADSGEIRMPCRLRDVLELVATPEEAAEYARLKPAIEGPALRVFPSPETAHDRNRTQGLALQERLWARVVPRLQSAEWVGEGFKKGSVELVRVPPRLWADMDCTFDRDEVVTRGNGLHLFHVAISAVENVKSIADRDKLSPKLAVTRRLKEIIEELDVELPATAAKSDFFRLAEQQVGQPVKAAWLHDAWQDASVQEFRRLPGAKPARKKRGN